jgi:hypothetical protein
MTEWRDRKRGLDAAAAGSQVASSGGPVTIPLGPGEWDEGLGIPVCVVCQGVCCSRPTGWDAANARVDRRTRLKNWSEIMAGMKKSLTSFFSS